MRKFLSIVIPRYQETEQEIFPLLSSISNQIGIDFNDIEVIITTDGGGGPLLDKNFLNLFNFDTKQLKLEKNGGCGVGRQAAIDIAEGEYILCCDADDILHNVGVLGALMREVEIYAPDVLTSNFIEEQIDENGRYLYIPHEGPIGCWMHGKVLRRQFLIQKNIRFHPNIKYHEDSYFLCIAMSLADRMRHYPITTYVWKHNPNSITRKDGSIYTYKSLPGYFEAVTMAWETVEKIRPEQMPQKVVQFINYGYLVLHAINWKTTEKHKELLKIAENMFAKRIQSYLHYYFEADKKAISESYTTELKQLPMVVDESIETVGEWIERILKEKAKIK